MVLLQSGKIFIVSGSEKFWPRGDPDQRQGDHGGKDNKGAGDAGGHRLVHGLPRLAKQDDGVGGDCGVGGGLKADRIYIDLAQKGCKEY